MYIAGDFLSHNVGAYTLKYEEGVTMVTKKSRWITGLILLMIVFLCSACSGSDGLTREDYIIVQGIQYRDHKGEYDLAIAEFNKALELNPNSAAAYINRGSVYKLKGEYDLAMADFTKTLELNPNSAPAYCNRGQIYGEKGQYDLAIAEYTKAIEVKPKYAFAYVDRGNTYREKGEYDLAIADYNKALEVDLRFALAYIERGNTYREEGQYDLAITDYNKALEIDSHFSKAYIERGNTYRESNQYDLAITDYSKVIELEQPRVTVVTAEGKKTKNFQSLREQLAKAYYNKGTVLRQLRKNTEAIECFYNFLQYATPDDTLIEKAKEHINALGGTI